MVSDTGKTVLAVVFSLAVVISGISVSVWISKGSEEIERTLNLRNKRLNLACHVCFTYDVSIASDTPCQSIERRCRSEGWQRQEKLPPSCEEEPEVKSFIQKEVKRRFKEKTSDFEEELNNVEQEFLRTAEKAFYASRRQIIHWSPKATSSNETGAGHAEKWHSVIDFEREPSTFTISSGSPDSFDQGKVRITETGTYLIYVRLTFACHIPHHPRRERVHLEVVAHETPHFQYVILQDSQLATCSVNGDFVTLYQSGIFRLGKDERIELRYKSPEGVTLSTRTWSNGQAIAEVKSSIGLIRTGLA